MDAHLRVQNRIPVQMHPWMLVETTRVTEFEYYFACTRKGVHEQLSYANAVSLHKCLTDQRMISENNDNFDDINSFIPRCLRPCRCNSHLSPAQA